VIFLAAIAASRAQDADRYRFTVRLDRRNVELVLRVGPGGED
jgi:hypothetical protein